MPDSNSTGASSRRWFKTIAKYPNYPQRPISLIQQLHNAPDFAFYLQKYLNSIREPRLPNQTLQSATLPFSQLDVYNMFRFHPVPLNDDEEEYDIVKAIPRSKSMPDGRFDTAVVMTSKEAESHGLKGKWLEVVITQDLI
ncbi:hypothetical protein CPB84DRAFT_1690249 [Gymnopilus junonius]|nr:hypothetical protein CPB84DRAFT_1690249 [Gymnopilus junonius]